MRRRLSALMFLAYAPPGALIPLFPLRLDELGFSPLQIGVACATQALGSLLAPLIAGQAADRWAPADRCLATCAFGAGVLLWVLAECTTPTAVFVVSLGVWLLLAPTLSLASAISFAHLTSPVHEFGRVRLWGTLGWVAQLWLLGYWFEGPEWLRGAAGWLRPGQSHAELADAFRLGGLMALALGLYALTLPRTPPAECFETRLAPVAALRLLRRRAFAVFFLCNFLLCLTVPFASQNTPLLLRQLGVPPRWLAPALTIAQSTEVAALGLLPLLLVRWGQRRVMLVGAASWSAALAVLAAGRPLGLVVSSLGLNGLFICCFLVAGQVFVNSRAGSDIRASAQALITFTSGLGMLAGHLLAAWIRHQAGGLFTPTFAVAVAIALSALALFALGFEEK